MNVDEIELNKNVKRLSKEFDHPESGLRDVYVYLFHLYIDSYKLQWFLRYGICRMFRNGYSSKEKKKPKPITTFIYTRFK